MRPTNPLSLSQAESLTLHQPPPPSRTPFSSTYNARRQFTTVVRKQHSEKFSTKLVPLQRKNPFLCRDRTLSASIVAKHADIKAFIESFFAKTSFQGFRDGLFTKAAVIVDDIKRLLELFCSLELSNQFIFTTRINHIFTSLFKMWLFIVDHIITFSKRQLVDPFKLYHAFVISELYVVALRQFEAFFDSYYAETNPHTTSLASTESPTPQTSEHETSSSETPRADETFMVDIKEAKYTKVDLLLLFYCLHNILVHNPKEGQQRLEQMLKIANEKPLAFDCTTHDQSAYDKYSQAMRDVGQYYFRCYSCATASVSHAYMWLPTFFGIFNEDMLIALVAFTFHEQKHVTAVRELLTSWRATPTFHETPLSRCCFALFDDIVRVFSNAEAPTPTPIAPPSVRRIYRIPPQYYFVLLHPRFIAQKITEAHVNIFTKCQTRAIFYSNKMKTAGAEATDLKSKLTILSNWASQALFESRSQPELLAEFFDFFFEVVTSLYYVGHNFLAVLGISTGFQNFRVVKLQGQLTNLRRDTAKTKQWVDELTSPCDGSYKNLIIAMNELGNPCIPYFGSFQNIFEKVFSGSSSDVSKLFKSIGTATQETRRNRKKWFDLVYEDSTIINNAFGVDLEQYVQTPWSDQKLLDSAGKVYAYRVIHKTSTLMEHKRLLLHMHRTRTGFILKKVSVCRYPRFGYIPR